MGRFSFIFEVHMTLAKHSMNIIYETLTVGGFQGQIKDKYGCFEALYHKILLPPKSQKLFLPQL